ncbi:MAG: hypothetical protein QOJ56_431 [Mycobacterium sp.]|nr:hypothetical protein [Mycobacterium sp.]
MGRCAMSRGGDARSAPQDLAAADNHRATWSYHICERADAVALVPGRAEDTVVALLHTAWRFAKGSRIGIGRGASFVNLLAPGDRRLKAEGAWHLRLNRSQPGWHTDFVCLCG